MVAAECEPYAKTGGLADVVDALARALSGLGHEVDVYLPRYRGVVPPPGALERSTLTVPLGPGAAAGGWPGGAWGGWADEGSVQVDLISGRANGYRLRLVDHPPSFDRAGYYGEGQADYRDYPDNGARFAVLGRAALEAIRAEGRPVDVLHGHDWHAAPALLLLTTRYRDDPQLAGVATLLTCHNLAYHGWVPRDRAGALDLPAAIGAPDGIDLLREAVARADLVNTVSPTFARESCSAEYGGGLDDVLRARGDRYVGILNGIDPTLWDPATDHALRVRYSAADPSGKAIGKRTKCGLLGFDLQAPPDEAPDLLWDERGAPLFGMVSRLDGQKGFDLLAGAAEELVAAGARLLVQGQGHAELIAGLRALAERRPDRVAVLERFDRDEARRIYAASDVFLMPSRFEPSGQGQMIAWRYGTLVLARRTGGLADTVVDADADGARGNGFMFAAADAGALLEAGRRAIAAYRDAPRWSQLVRRVMGLDHSWGARAAREYESACARAMAIHGGVTGA